MSWIAALVLLVGPSQTPSAPPAQAVPVATCVERWHTERSLHLSSATVVAAGQLLETLRIRSGLDRDDVAKCHYTFVALDQIRFRAWRRNRGKTAESFGQIVNEVADELKGLGLFPEGFAARMVSLGQLWRAPAGRLLVRSRKKELVILIDGREAGVTDWDGRLSPGRHKVEVLEDGRPVFTDARVEIEDSAEVRIDVKSEDVP